MTNASEPAAAAHRHLPQASATALRSVRRLSRRKGRRDTGECLVEGRQAVREALRHGHCHELWVASDHLTTMGELIDLAVASGVPVTQVVPRELATLTDAVTPQGVVARAATPSSSLSDVLVGDPRLVVICAQVRDPGNVGTIIRCADAFGADAVILGAGSVDVGNAKTIRASVGSVFHLPVVSDTSLSEAVAACREAGLRVLVTDGSSGLTLDDLSAEQLAAPTAWILGNEAWGVPEEDAALADERIGVPMYGMAESLNVSTAAAICLYTSARAQRA